MRGKTISLLVATPVAMIALFSAGSSAATEASGLGATVDSCPATYNGVVVGTGATGSVDLCENLVVTGTGTCPSGDQGVVVDGRYVCYG